MHYEDEEEEDDNEPQQEEEDSDEADARPAKRKRVPVPRPTAGTPAKPESLEEVEQRLQPGSVKHAIFQVCLSNNYADATSVRINSVAGEGMTVACRCPVPCAAIHACLTCQVHIYIYIHIYVYVCAFHN